MDDDGAGWGWFVRDAHGPAADLEQYERTAFRLATSPAELSTLRTRLAANRATSPLFDTPRFTRNLERAYRRMWSIYSAGDPPRAFDVDEIEPSQGDSTCRNV